MTHESNHPQLSDLGVEKVPFSKCFWEQGTLQEGIDINLSRVFSQQKHLQTFQWKDIFVTLLKKKITICMNHPSDAALRIHFLLYDSLRVGRNNVSACLRNVTRMQRHGRSWGWGYSRTSLPNLDMLEKHAVICKPAFSRWFLEVVVVFLSPRSIGNWSNLCQSAHIFLKLVEEITHDSYISIILFSCISGFR